MPNFEAAYLETSRKGLLREKINQSRQILQDCGLCPRECRINRFSEKSGVCKTAQNAYISSYNAHFGEEPPLVGVFGSGTIFFTHCGLLCNFCQNYDISHLGKGEEAPVSQLAGIMVMLQNSGCHNINLVTPGHVVPQILAALDIAIDAGLKTPLVYNSSGYDKLETLKLLEGIIDIYMPDFKFWDSRTAELLCEAPDYPETARLAVKEMYHQVGDLLIDEQGIAKRGLLVRHLVLPAGMAGTYQVAKFIAEEVSPDVCVNIMDQYRPCGSAREMEELSHPLSADEYKQALKEAEEAGLQNILRL